MKSYLQIFILIFMFTWLCSNEPIALITKSRGNVKYNLSMDDRFNSKALVNTPLFNGNRIKTKSNSFTKVVYLDDRSTIYAYPKTEVAINGMITNRMINKWVDVTSGIVRIRVFNPLKSEFKLTTPHSELTCYECDFWVISNKESGDYFYKISGNALVTNPSMIDKIELIEDSTLSSIKDTKITMFKTTFDENQYLGSLILNANEFINMSEEELKKQSKIVNQSKESTTNIVEIRFTNAMNIERTIYLTYIK